MSPARTIATWSALLAGFLVAAGLHAADASNAAEPADSRRLAVVVEGEDEPACDPIALQALLEADLFEQWQGVLLERKEVHRLLDEWRLKLAGLTGKRDIAIGKWLAVDYLLFVKLEPKRVVAVVDRFPDSAVVSEARYEDSLNAPSLARRIAVQAVRAINRDGADKNKLYVSIGSFLYREPFRRFGSANEDLHALLRERLAARESLVINERYFTSHLLTEFRLARAGWTIGLPANLTAPPSDVLILGDYRPSAHQDLQSKQVDLKFQIQLLSPTGLFPGRSFAVTAEAGDLGKVAQRIDDALASIVEELPDPLPPRSPTGYSHEEFQAVKGQAFEAMPNRPKEDGNFYSGGSYRGPWQVDGTPEEVAEALRAIENAMLFKAGDTQLMVCAGVALYGLVDRELFRARQPNAEPVAPEAQARIKQILSDSLDYIESAYLLDSNANTRGVYWSSLDRQYDALLPERIKAMGERIVKLGQRGGWEHYQVGDAASILVRRHGDLDYKAKQFFRFARYCQQTGNPDLRHLYDLCLGIESYLREHKDDRRTIDKAAEFADRLIADDFVFFNVLGHYLRGLMAGWRQGSEATSARHFEGAVALIPRLHAEYGERFRESSFSERLFEAMDDLGWATYPDSLADEVYSLFRRYAAAQMEIGNYNRSDLAECFRLLVPETWRRGDLEAGSRMITDFLRHYTVEGGGDADRMEMARWRNRFLEKLDGRPRLSASELSRIDVGPFPEGTYVKKLVHAFGRLWVAKFCQYPWSPVGEVWIVDPREGTAERLEGISGVAADVACSSRFLAIATKDHGVFLVDGSTLSVVNYHAENSPLPVNKVDAVCSDGHDFFLAMPGKSGGLSHVYALDPIKRRLRDCEVDLLLHSLRDTIAWDPQDPKRRISPESWESRTRIAAGRRLRYTRQPRDLALHRAIVEDPSGVKLLDCEGVELNYVNDFTLWEEKLIFATGNGLYASRPGSNEVRCVWSELDVWPHSLCPVGEQLFLGTNKGLYRLDASRLREVMERMEKQES